MSVNPPFHIHAPGLDERALLAAVEERIQTRALDAAEIEHVRTVSFAPVSPSFDLSFDAAATTELFERPVAAPDFSSRKYALLRGPLRWFARRLFLLWQQISQNRVQAFYNIAHEIISLNQRLGRIEREYGRAYESLQGYNTTIAGMEIVQPPAAPQRQELDRRIIEQLRQEHGPVFCPGPGAAGIAAALHERGCRVVSAFVPGLPVIPADISLASLPEKTLGAIVLVDLGNFGSAVDALPLLARTRLREQGLLYVRYETGLVGSPFVRSVQWAIDAGGLIDQCVAFGFELLERTEPVGFQPGSFELWLRRLPL